MSVSQQNYRKTIVNLNSKQINGDTLGQDTLVQDSTGQNSVWASQHMDALRDEFRKTLLKLSYKDDLTNLYNQRYFDKCLKKLWFEQQDSKSCLSLILCDVDYLKNYNNVYGYQLGNKVLKVVADALQEECRMVPNSVVTRYGSDRFAILIPNALIDEALVQTEKMLATIRELAIPNRASDVSQVLTASFGIASVYPRKGLSINDFFANAETALVEAKTQGRNAAYTLPPAWSQELPVINSIPTSTG